MSMSFLPNDDEVRQEALSDITTFKNPIHPTFTWWKEREKTRYYNSYLRSDVKGEPTAPPENLLRMLDKFESLVRWLETQPLGQS